MARPEQVDEPVGGDRVGAPMAGLLQGIGLGLRQSFQQTLGGRQPGQNGGEGGARRRHAGTVARAGSLTTVATGSQWPLFMDR